MTLHAVRRIHPECNATGDEASPCECLDLWGFDPDNGWELDEAIKVSVRLDMQERPYTYLGAAVDADEGDDTEATTGSTHIPDGHFWKRSEHLKCCRGDTMVSDERGLPPGYYLGHKLGERL